MASSTFHQISNNVLLSSAILKENVATPNKTVLENRQRPTQQAAAEYVVPFRSLLEPRQSSFTLYAPTQFCFNEKTNEPNYLYFSKLDIIPDYFNQASEAYKMDSIEEDNTNLEFNMSAQVQFGPNQFLQDDPILKKATFVFGKQNQKTADYIEGILEFFGNAIQFQPAEYNMFNPVFFDWTYVSVSEDNLLSHDQIINEYVPRNLALLYDEQRRDSQEPGAELIDQTEDSLLNAEDYQTTFFHSNCLTLPGINPWKFPRAVALNPGIRIRVHLQPKVRLVCSNWALLQVLGFEWKDPIMQDKLQKVHNQYNVINGSSKWLTWTATKPPSAKNMTTLKAYTEVSLNTLATLQKNYLKKSLPIEFNLSKTFHLTKAQIADDVIFYNHIGKNFFTPLVRKFNILLEYDTTTGKIFFPRPDGRRLVACKIYASPLIIIRRLGYRPYDYLDYESEHNSDYLYLTGAAAPADTTTTSSQAEDEKAFREHQKARDKAQILVFDTGAIHITSAQGLLEDYNNLGGQFVASLKPTEPGIMTLDTSNQFLRISEYQSSGRFIPLTFQLNTFAQADQSVFLNWPTGAAIHGILKSIPA